MSRASGGRGVLIRSRRGNVACTGAFTARSSRRRGDQPKPRLTSLPSARARNFVALSHAVPTGRQRLWLGATYAGGTWKSDFGGERRRQRPVDREVCCRCGALLANLHWTLVQQRRGTGSGTRRPQGLAETSGSPASPSACTPPSCRRCAPSRRARCDLLRAQSVTGRVAAGLTGGVDEVGSCRDREQRGRADVVVGSELLCLEDHLQQPRSRSPPCISGTISCLMTGTGPRGRLLGSCPLGPASCRVAELCVRWEYRPRERRSRDPMALTRNDAWCMPRGSGTQTAPIRCASPWHRAPLLVGVLRDSSVVRSISLHCDIRAS